MKPEDLAALPPERLPFPVTRALADAIECRSESADDGIGLMTGHFSTFNDWYEVNSFIEGHFLERVASSAFKKTVAESRSTMKTLYDHGQDPSIGNKVLGPIRDLEPNARFGVPLFDTSYNRDLLPGLKAGVYGSSFRFSVDKDVWDHTPTRSDSNPDGIPERTITEARVYEFGPVTFPANPNATAGVRSTTDTFYQRSRDPEQFETLLRSAATARTPVRAGAATPSDEPPVSTPEMEPPPPDTPRIEPPPAESAPEPQDPPDGGSSDSRSAPVEYITRDEKSSRVTELEGLIASRAIAYPGRLPEAESAKDTEEKAERETLLADIAAWDARQAYVAAFAQRDQNIDQSPQPPVQRGAYDAPTVIRTNDPFDFGEVESRGRTPEHRNQLYRDNALRITEKATFPHPDTDEQKTRDRMEWLLENHDTEDKQLAKRFMATGSPLYRRAFKKMVLGQPLSPEEQRGTALAVGVDGTGGFAIPVIFDLSVIAIGVHSGAVNPYRATCRVVPIVGTDTWNALTATAVTATRTTEAAPAIEQGPTFAQPQYIVKRVQAQITYSLEVAQDRADIESAMAVLIQEAKDNEEETSFATGAGSGSASIGVGPVSGTSGAYTAVAGAGSGVIAEGDLTATESALPVRHRFGAQWYMNRVNIRKIQSLETTGGKLFGGSIYFPSVGQVDLSSVGNTGLRLLGYPVNESPSLPTATTTTITIGTLLNPNQYVIVDRIGMNLQILPFIFNSSGLATGQQALYAMWRNTAAPLNVDAGRTLRFL